MNKIFNQDVLQWCKEYEGKKFHALVCDPPYHLSGGFMGKKWDKDGPNAIAFNPKTWSALAEHLLPGAFGMAFASSRGWHRLACAIEDAGLIIHPTIFGWSFGSGFPKATRIDTKIDQSLGVIRELEWYDRYKDGKTRVSQKNSPHEIFGKQLGSGNYRSKPKTTMAKSFEGHRYGLQALKPALEPIIVFQRPYAGKPLESITRTGAGALNIEGGRINGSVTTNPLVRNAKGFRSNGLANHEHPPDSVFSNGRWPANFVLSHHPSCNGECVPECHVLRLGEQSGKLTSGQLLTQHKRSGDSVIGTFKIRERTGEKCNWGGDTGTAARFFFNADWNAEVEERLFEADPVRYQAKASRGERDAGLDKMPIEHRTCRPKSDNIDERTIQERLHGRLARNHHPTVKPIALTKWLATLLLPPVMYAPRRILVPFSGSGSEMIGAHKAGWEEIVGVEQDAEYVALAEARLAHHCKPQLQADDLFASVK